MGEGWGEVALIKKSETTPVQSITLLHSSFCNLGRLGLANLRNPETIEYPWAKRRISAPPFPLFPPVQIPAFFRVFRLFRGLNPAFFVPPIRGIREIRGRNRFQFSGRPLYKLRWIARI